MTKYRKPVLVGDVAFQVQELMREICRSESVAIMKGPISKDHVDLFVSIPPQVTISRFVQRLKGAWFFGRPSAFSVFYPDGQQNPGDFVQERAMPEKGSVMKKSLPIINDDGEVRIG